MMRNTGIAGAVALAAVLVAGSYVAAAQTAQQRRTTEQSKVVVTTTNRVSQPSATGAAPRPVGGVMQMTKAECSGLGGVVGPAVQKVCATKKSCYTANADGVVRETCMTEE